MFMNPRDVADKATWRWRFRCETRGVASCLSLAV